MKLCTRHRKNIFAIELDLTACNLSDSIGQQIKNGKCSGGFSCPCLADNSERFPALDGKRDAVYSVDRFQIGSVFDRKIIDR